MEVWVCLKMRCENFYEALFALFLQMWYFLLMGVFSCVSGHVSSWLRRRRCVLVSVVSPWLLLSWMWTLQPSSSWCSSRGSPLASFSACSSAWIRDTDVESSVTSHSSAALPRRNTERGSAGRKVYRSRAESPMDRPIRSSWKHGCAPDSMAAAADCRLPPQHAEATPDPRPALSYRRPRSISRYKSELVGSSQTESVGREEDDRQHKAKLADKNVSVKVTGRWSSFQQQVFPLVCRAAVMLCINEWIMRIWSTV